MKKITALVLSTIYSLVFVPSAFAATLSISPATGVFNKGCSFTLTVKLDTQGSNTDGVDAIMFYDPTRFNAKLIKNGTIYSEYPGNNIDPQAGKISISGLAAPTAPYNGIGTLATIDFTALATAPEGASQIRFDFDPSDKAKTADSNVAERGVLGDVLSGVVDGSYSIGTGSCVGAQGSTGGTVASGSATVPVKTLAQSADFNTTLALTIGGGLLTLIGILGLALL